MRIVLLLAISLMACNRDPPGAASGGEARPITLHDETGASGGEARPITLHDETGALVAELRITPVEPRSCAIRATRPLEARTTDAGLELTSGTGLIATLGSGPTGPAILGPDAALLARVAAGPGPGGISLIDPLGVAMFRLDTGSDRVVLRDRAGIPYATVTREGGRFIVIDRDKTTRGFVAGTEDATVAGLLAASTADLEHRALLACDRLLRKAP